nr:MAG TPA: hypothetical protein [Caudoviricetes sp.]
MSTRGVDIPEIRRCGRCLLSKPLDKLSIGCYTEVVHEGSRHP